MKIAIGLALVAVSVLLLACSGSDSIEGAPDGDDEYQQEYVARCNGESDGFIPSAQFYGNACECIGKVYAEHYGSYRRYIGALDAGTWDYDAVADKLLDECG